MPQLNWKPGHAAGICDLQYTPDGKSLVSCGSDGEIHVSDAVLGSISKTLEVEGDAALNTIDLRDDKLAIGTDGHMVQLHTFPDCKFDSNSTRSTAPIRHVAFSPTGLYLAVASDECDIRLVNMLDTKQVVSLKGHEGAVKSVVWDPKGDYLASTSEDGTLKIWRLTDRKAIFTYRNIKIEVGAPAQFCRPQWSPNGDLLAVPSGRSEDVIMLRREEWVVDYCLSSGHRTGVDLLAWSPNGLYMLTSGFDNQILLWDLGTKDTIGKYTGDAQPLALAWNPAVGANAFAAIDMDGRFAICDTPVPAHMLPPTAAAPASATASKDGSAAATGTSASEKENAAASTNGATLSKDGDDDEDEDDDIMMKRRPSKRLKKRRAIDDSVSALRESLGLDGMNDSDDDDDDDDDGFDDDLLAQHQPSSGAIALSRAPSAVQPRMQPRIQPGSTPKRDERRFLVWNHIGSIVSRDEETFCSVEFDFSDRSKHRAIRMTDHYRFTIAALGDRGAVFGSEGGQADKAKGKSAKTSTIYYRPFQSWSHNSDWTVQLPVGECVQSLAVGDTWAAAATSVGLLRVWRFSGLQDAVMQTPGPVVCLAGHGLHLAMVYRCGPPSGEAQHLAYEVLDVGERSRVCSGTLPLRSGRMLEWLGFSDKGVLMAFDDGGQLLALLNLFGWKWVPVCDARTAATKKSSTARHWVIGVTCGQLMSVLCSNGVKFPAALPKPVPCATPLRWPIVNAHVTGSAGALEERWLRESSMQQHYKQMAKDSPDDDAKQTRQQVALDKSTLQLFRAACKADRLSRALDVAMRLRLKKSFEIAVSLAQSLGHPSLAERVSLLMHARARASAQEAIAVQMEPELPTAARRRKPVSDSFGMREAEFDSAELEPVAKSKPSFSGSSFSRKKKGSRNKKRRQKLTKEEAVEAEAALAAACEGEAEFDDSAGEAHGDETTSAAGATQSTTESTVESNAQSPPRSKKKQRRTAANPFLRKSVASPVKKQRDLFDSLQKSPAKQKPTPTLSRQSSFSITARANRHRGK